MSLYSKLFCEAEKTGAAATRAAAAAVIASLASLAAPQPAPAQTAEAMGLEGAPIRITAAIRSRPDRCYFDGADVAMRRLAEQETARINAAGGIWGRPLELRLIADAPIRETRGDDDAARARKAAAREALYAGVRETLEDPDALAMVGLSSSSNGEVLFNEFAEPFAATDLPILTDISVASVFAGAPTAFSTRPGQEAERGPTLAAFLRARDFKRVAVIYRGDAIWSETLATAVMGGLEPERVVGAHALERGPDRKIDPARMAETAAAVRAARPNAVMISIGTRDTKAMIDALGEDFRGAVIVSGNLERIAGEVDRSYPNPIYGLASSRLPEIDNERLRRLVGGVGSTEWIFEGARNPDASGWARGDCEERAEIDPRFRDPLDRANQRAIERAATMADMIALAADAAISAGPSADMAARRAAVRAALSESYALGRGAFNGPYGAWSFDPATRVAARTPLIALLPSGLGRLQLAPTQFLRTRTGELERIETLYVDLDLIRANRIDENSRTFFAEFYLSMRASKTSSIDRIKFTNALLNPRTGGRFITVETLHAGGASPTYPRSMRVYKISGRFVFTPELSRYPFDTQRLSIDIRPSAAAGAPFIVQPPPEALRDGAVRSDDWRAAAQFVSVDTDFVPVVDAFTHAPSVVPFYTASFVWMMEREAKDYLLRVVVPLAFILIVAYLSIFIPRSHFEAIITIQVTALLSAVALYITLPELDSDDATISDMIFLFDYLMISVMIGISIMRINQTIRGRRWLSGALGILHVAGVPLSVLAMAAYVDQIALA